MASVPTALVGTFGNARVSLAWTAPSVSGGVPVTDYIVQYRTNVSNSLWTTFSDGVRTTPTAIVTGLTNGTSYLFRVAAVNAAGTSGFVQSVGVTPMTVASVPTALVGTFGNAQVSLVWTAPSVSGGVPITDYTVQYRKTTDTTWTTFNDGVRTTPTAIVTGLTNGTTYYFRVAAVNAAGTSAFVQSLAVTPKTVADAPTNISGTSRLGVAYLTWNAPLSSGGAAVTRYEITYSTNGGVSWTTWGTVAKNSATLSGLPRGLNYVFKIRAQNAAGWSNFSLPSTTPLLVS